MKKSKILMSGIRLSSFSMSTNTKREAKMIKTAKTLFLCLVIFVSDSLKLTNANHVFPTHDGLHMNHSPPPMSQINGGSGDNMHSNGMNMHVTFFWGKDTQVLFPGWPGVKPGMYAVALLFVFSLAVGVEWLSHWRLVMEPGKRNVASGIVQTTVHGVRVGFAYMLMLSLMSFNGGVFIVAVAGHAAGFLLFGSRVLKKMKLQPYDQVTAHFPSSVC